MSKTNAKIKLRIRTDAKVTDRCKAALKACKAITRSAQYDEYVDMLAQLYFADKELLDDFCQVTPNEAVSDDKNEWWGSSECFYTTAELRKVMAEHNFV